MICGNTDDFMDHPYLNILYVHMGPPTTTGRQAPHHLNLDSDLPMLEGRNASAHFWHIRVNNFEVVNWAGIKLYDFFYFTFILLSGDFQHFFILFQKM